MDAPPLLCLRFVVLLHDLIVEADHMPTLVVFDELQGSAPNIITTDGQVWTWGEKKKKDARIQHIGMCNRSLLRYLVDTRLSFWNAEQ